MPSVRDILQSVPPLFLEHHPDALDEHKLDELLLASVEQQLIPKGRPRSILKALASVFEKSSLAKATDAPTAFTSLPTTLQHRPRAVPPAVPVPVPLPVSVSLPAPVPVAAQVAVAETPVLLTLALESNASAIQPSRNGGLGPVAMPELPVIPDFAISAQPPAVGVNSELTSSLKILPKRSKPPAKARPTLPSLIKPTRKKSAGTTRKRAKASLIRASTTVSELAPPRDELEHQLFDHREGLARLDSDIHVLDRELKQLQQAATGADARVAKSRGNLRKLMVLRDAQASFLATLADSR